MTREWTKAVTEAVWERRDDQGDETSTEEAVPSDILKHQEFARPKGKDLWSRDHSTWQNAVQSVCVCVCWGSKSYYTVRTRSWDRA
jgi:hypothetical protein